MHAGGMAWRTGKRRDPEADGAATGVDGDNRGQLRSVAAETGATGVDSGSGRQLRSVGDGSEATGVDGGSRRHPRAVADGSEAPGVDRWIARLATRHDGIVERRQLIELGLSPAAIDHRVRAGRLIVLYRGVYAAGHGALSKRGRLRAALIAAGPTAVLSHRTAAILWRLTSRMPPFVEVTVTRKGPRTRPGLIVHETRRPLDVGTIRSLPLTAPLRTLIDLAPTEPQHRLEKLCAEALVLKLVTQEQVDGARIIDPALAAPTRSEFERAFFPELRKAGLPRPIAGYPITPYTADFAWPAERVIVETDGWNFHRNRFAFEDDRARDAYLAARGWIVVRITWRRLRKQPMLVMVQLGQTLAQRASTLHGHAA
jgi:very-short-patch-repair endonuclease